MEKVIRIGTRGSKLALWQAHFTQEQLQSIGIASELVIIKTRGDQIQHLGFDKMEGKGFFTKEIEDALLRGEVAVAVHSMKDLPTSSPEGLVTTAVSYREDPADWMLIRKDKVDSSKDLKLPAQAIVGTSSARRKAQVRAFRPDVELKDIRGNVPTRVRKLAEGEFNAILLAAAGLSRLELDLSPFEVIRFSPKEFIPAPAQGVLAWQCNEHDLSTRRIFKQLHQAEVALATNVERTVLKLLEGGCQMPLGVYCKRDQVGNYHVWAALANGWDQPLKKARISSSTHFELAQQVVQQLKGTIK